MLETITLVTFAAMLVTGIVYDFPLLVALIAGWLLFFDYGLLRGFDTRELWRMSARGLSDVMPVLCLFVLIGALTASWRAAGTIPAIICWSVRVIGPSTLVPASFLLCCVMSLLTGSSFASAATTGVICMAVASSMGANLMLTGGAIVSGCFFGDYCSPMSSSASLVAGITGTSLLSNVSRMMRTGVVPFSCCLVLYSLLGALLAPGADVSADLALSGAEALRSFVLDPIVFAPIVVVFALCLLRMNVRWTIVASLVAAVTIEVFVQGMNLQEVARTLVYGYHAADPEVARLADGGGVLSMAELSAIVAVASTYAGLFEGTGLLAGLESAVTSLARHTTPFVGVLATSVFTAAIACDQVLAIMLVRQLCDGCERASSALALDMESSVTLIPALIPWSTSCVGIVAFTGMPMASVCCAFLPMLVPAWSLAISLWQHGHPSFVDGPAAQAMGLTVEDDARRLAA